jgi:hypothetical protein
MKIKVLLSCPSYCRAASIVLREDNCHFLRVDKENFNRILRDVEANTVRLKEHGQDVLVLEKMSPPHSAACSHFKYVFLKLMYFLSICSFICFIMF